MRKVDWNRTRGLVALAVLLGVIGFGGYAASMAQEPTPAKEGKEDASDDKKKCDCTQPKRTGTMTCTCPKALYMQVPTGNENEFIYYYYATQFELASGQDCPPEPVNGCAAIITMQQLDTNSECCKGDCITDVSLRKGKPSYVVSKKTTGPVHINARQPNNYKPEHFDQDSGYKGTSIGEFYLRFKRKDNNRFIWAHMTTSMVTTPTDRTKPFLIALTGFECESPPAEDERQFMLNQALEADANGLYRGVFGNMPFVIVTTAP
jgi:hypothetical protein